MGEAALVLVWPAVLGYAEAALAYVGETIRPGRLGRYAIWGVRLGWLAQTALLQMIISLTTDALDAAVHFPGPHAFGCVMFRAQLRPRRPAPSRS